MRLILTIMPSILLAASLPAHSAEPESPNTTHRIQEIRAGKGEPRVRDAAAARTAPPDTPKQGQPQDQAQPKGRSHPYQPAKPGEGTPKN